MSVSTQPFCYAQGMLKSVFFSTVCLSPPLPWHWPCSPPLADIYHSPLCSFHYNLSCPISNVIKLHLYSAIHPSSCIPKCGILYSNASNRTLIQLNILPWMFCLDPEQKIPTKSGTAFPVYPLSYVFCALRGTLPVICLESKPQWDISFHSLSHSQPDKTYLNRPESILSSPPC